MDSESNTIKLLKNALVIVMLIMIIYILGNHFYLGKEAITASDGEKYYVVGGYQNQRGAAEMLSKVNRNVMLFLKYLKIKYKVNYTEGESDEYNAAEMYKIKEEFKNSPSGIIVMGEYFVTTFGGQYFRSGITSIGDKIKNVIDAITRDKSPDSFTGRHTSHYTRPIHYEGLMNSLVGSVTNINGNEFSNKAVNRVLAGYDLENIMENDPTASGDNTYTVDKGAKMLVCLRSRETFLLHDLHTVMFVVLHELAHIANEKWGHSSESQFWEIFKFLLHEAKECGMHEPVDYEKRPIRYCGLDVNYNPYFDDSVKKLWS